MAFWGSMARILFRYYMQERNAFATEEEWEVRHDSSSCRIIFLRRFLALDKIQPSGAFMTEEQRRSSILELACMNIGLLRRGNFDARGMSLIFLILERFRFSRRRMVRARSREAELTVSQFRYLCLERSKVMLR